MSWLSKLGGFESPRETKAEVQTTVTNEYLTRLVRTMLYNGQINMNNDSRSYVEDGYTNVDIYSIINYLITTASNIKFKVQVKDGDQWEDDPDSEILKLLRRPNPLSSYSLFIEEHLGWKFLDGSSYTYAPRLENGVNVGKTKELWVMPSTGMQVIGGDIRKPIEGFTYERWDEMIPTEKVMYLRYFNPVSAIDNLAGSLSGFAPLRAAVLASKKSNSAAIAGVAAFENNGAMGILSSGADAYAGLTQGQAEALGQQFKRQNGGANNYNKMAVTGGKVDFTRLNMSPADLRLGEAELQTKRQLGGVFKFPTQLLNDSEGATFSNQKEAQKSIYTNTLIPEMASLGEGLANWLGDAYYESEIQIIPDISDIEVLQEDKQAQASWLVQADWMTQNEKRVEMNLPEDPNPKMDDYLIPNGKSFSEDLDIFNGLERNTIPEEEDSLEGGQPNES